MVVSANLLPNGKQQFCDGNGNPYAGGSVYFYVPGTTTFKNTWQDPEKVALNTNPVLLDANGEAVIFGDGEYRQILKDVNGVQIWDELTIQYVTVGGDLSGTLPNPTVNPALFLTQFNTNKNPPADPDRFLALDSGNALSPIYFLWSQIKSAMQTALQAIFDTRYAQSTNIGPGFSALKLNVISNTQVQISANKVVAFTAGGAAQVGNAIALVADLSVTGANGLDTGAEAANTWYNVWLIYNPTTMIWASLLSVSATTPTMPSGYTYKVRVGAVRNDNSSNLYRMLQNGNRVQYVSGVNPTGLQLAKSGAGGSIGGGGVVTWVTVDLSGFVPPTAVTIIGFLYSTGGGAGTNIVLLAPSSSYKGLEGAPVELIDGGTANALSNNFELTLETPQQCYYYGQTSESRFYLLGWLEQL